MTSGKIWRPMLAVTIAVGALASAAAAQKKDPPSAETTKVGAKASSNDANGDIKVHGHWTIIISNPDGSVASRREFENSFYANASGFLSSLLAGQAGTFSWMMEVGNGPGQFCGTPSALAMCFLGEPALAGQGGAIPFIPILNVSVPTTGANAGKLVLAASPVAASTGPIKIVGTRIEGLPGGEIYFTGTNVNPAVNVQVGQTMNVTVVISFS